MVGLKIISELENRPYKDIRTEFYMDKYGKDYKPKGVYIEKEEKEKVDMSKFSKKLPPHAYAYLQQRKILEAPFLYPDMEFMYDEATDRLVIPWYFNEKPLYYQRRTLSNASPPYLFPKLDKSVFNIDMIDPSFPFIFVLEGAFDAIFIKNGVAIGGKSLSDYQLVLLKERWPKHKLVYFFDNHRYKDEMIGPAPMYKHLLKLAERDPNAKFVLWPEQMDIIKDVNQWVVAGGKNIFSSRTWMEKNTINALKLKFIITTEINNGLFR